MCTASIGWNLKINIELNGLTGVVVLDLEKAFKTDDHQILLQILKSIGVRENSNKWFENYLTGGSS